MAYSPASSNNTFVPSHEASGSLTLGYSRNASQFPVMRYLQRIPVQKSDFYILNWNSQEGARIRSLNDNEHKWNDGQDAPSGIDELESFEYQLYATQRYTYPFTLGWKAIQQADWNILAAQASVSAMKCMTARTLLTYSALNNAGFTTSTATALGGGKFNAGTPTNPYCRSGLFAAAVAINKQTLGVVDISNLVAVMNPNTAKGIASSQEVTDYTKFTAGVPALYGKDPLPAVTWGLPRELFGFETVVENAVINTTAKGATQATSYIIPDGVIFVISKMGGLEGIEGAQSWSTVQGYFKEEMTVEQYDDVNNRLTRGRVTTDFVIKIPDQGVKSGYLITGAI